MDAKALMVTEVLEVEAERCSTGYLLKLCGRRLDGTVGEVALLAIDESEAFVWQRLLQEQEQLTNGCGHLMGK